MLSECWTIIILKTHTPETDGCRRFGRLKLRWVEQSMLSVRGWREERREREDVFEVVKIQTRL
jgi:hypothetical protein